MGADALLLTCEHGGNRIPLSLEARFAGAIAADELAGHRGWDPGALALAEILAVELDAPLVAATVSRLVVDLNRSESNPAVFSARTATLDDDEREQLLSLYHRPHRERVESVVRRQRAMGRRVVHVAVHSFTPVLGDDVRDFDLGLLYDPARPGERAFAERWAEGLRATDDGIAVRHNEPYLGSDDGLTTTLRERFPDEGYLGIELEVNQRLLGPPGVDPGSPWVRALVDSLADGLGVRLARRDGATRGGVARVRSRAPAHRLELAMLKQPDDSTCGPTSLHAVYGFHGDHVPLETVIAEVRPLATGGTLAVHLACHALARGYGATIYTYNLQLFDPTWFAVDPDQPIDLSERLRRQARVKDDDKLRDATEAYLEFLGRGGRVAYAELDGALLRRYLKRDRPILAGLNATYLYDCAREVGEHELHYDDIRGVPQGHFVVLRGYDKQRREVLVADPLHDNPSTATSHYPVRVERLIGAIGLGVLTYDANLLVLEPPASGERSPVAPAPRGKRAR